jgi:CHAT domain-containing protein
VSPESILCSTICPPNESIFYSPFFAVPINEIDEDISKNQRTLLSLTLSDPRRPVLLSTLAEARLQRYKLSDDEQDLDTSILQFTYIIIVLPFHLPIGRGPNPLSAFFFLTEALFHRSSKYEEPSDVGYCIKCLLYLRDVSPEALGIASNKVTTLLVRVRALQVKVEPDTMLNGVEEMSVLCRELLSAGLSEPDGNVAFESFAQAVMTCFQHSPGQPSQQVVECLREAHTHLPNLLVIPQALFMSFVFRFLTTKSNDDYEDAMAFFDKDIALHSPADNPNPLLGPASYLAATMAYGRLTFYGNPEYLEEAIFRYRACLDLYSPADPLRGAIIQTLERLERSRFKEFGVTHGHRLPESCSSSPEVIDRPSLPHLAASLAGSNADKPLPMTMEALSRHHMAVKSMLHSADKVDIEEAVKYCRLLLSSLQKNPSDEMMAPIIIANSGDFLLRAFKLTKNPEYLNESIDVSRGILKMPRAQHVHFQVIVQLMTSLLSRFRLSNDRNDDFDEIMQLCAIAATHTYAKVSARVEVTFQWMQLARVYGHTSTPGAYESAMSLMQDSLTFAPTLEIQHFRLVAMPRGYSTLPLDYASYLVHEGQLEKAIETLERGRGLLWSEMRGLRTSVDQLRIFDASLAEKLSDVKRDLEALTTLGSPNVWVNAVDVGGDEGMDPFGRVVVKQRKLMEEWNSLITQVRTLPGFKHFLMMPSFDTLRSAATCGPVVIINHSMWRSDILILLHDSPPSIITTASDFYHRAIELRDRLVNTRNQHRLESKQYQHTLRYVLQALYELIGRPVIEELRRLNIPEQSRVWWCPTSVFCFLPLHAMGPIPSDDGIKRYFLDLYIPSYTPTLSSLIESRKTSRQSIEKPSLLLVTQPDEYLFHAWPEIWHIQRLNTKVTTLISKRATPSAVVEGIRDHRFAHFICHGKLESGKPFDASFQLYSGKRLTLLDIVRSRLATAEFAFLSACHTAEITEGSIADEALHLAAAVQYCGFRSVVGTMWAMADMDGHGLVEDFYKSTFSGSDEEPRASVPYFERTALALRDAVKKLRRKKGVPLERWVNFVHYGA